MEDAILQRRDFIFQGCRGISDLMEARPLSVRTRRIRSKLEKQSN
jgi:hypothetical protein